MKSRFFLHCAIAVLSFGLTALASVAVKHPAHAQGFFFDDGDDPWFSEPSQRRQSRHYVGTPDSRYAGRTPLVAVIALRQQRVTVYDAQGKMMEASISSGQKGLDTPSGIFSVVQKEVDHHSNLFQDGSMPYMQRITWTGISMHIGVRPGYPASHGCIRLPDDFAYQLYQVSKLGMRVILVRDDIAPVEVAQPAMFTPASGQSAGDVSSSLKELASQKSQEADAATRRYKEAKHAVAKIAREIRTAKRALQYLERRLARAQAGLAGAQRAVETAKTPEHTQRAEAAKAKAAANLEDAQAKLDAARQDLQSKEEAAAKAEQELQTASVETAKARDAAEEAKLNLSPVSVFISRKTQRLYVRKNNMPVFEAPVMIRDADKPIGTFVFTSLDYKGDTGAMRWQVVSMYKDALNIEPYERAPKGSKNKISAAEAVPADVANAEAAFARITVTPESRERISSVLLPGSSLIISDEGLHGETGKDTDFIVIMPDDPMGGLTSRHKPSASRESDWGDGFFGPFSSSSRRGRGRGGRGGGYGGSDGGWFFSD